MGLTTRFLFSALVLAVLLALVLLLNTLRFMSRQVEVEPAAMVKLDERQMAERLARALQFKTVSYPEPSDFDTEEFLGLHAYLEGTFPRVHTALKREVVGAYSLLYSWPGRNGSLKPILLMSHIDVVPVEPEAEAKWSYPPFAGQIADGFIWGRGTLDIKSGAMAILEAIEFLLANGFEPQRDIHVALGHDEEVGGANGNARMASLLEERGVQLRYVLDEGGAIVHDVIPGVKDPVAYVAVAEKGYYGLKLTGEGPGGHSSMPPPHTAVGVVARAIHKLESNPLPADQGGITGQMLDYLGPEMPFSQKLVLANRWLFGPLIKRRFAKSSAMNATMRTTTAVTMVGGGVRRNVLPTTAWAVVYFRLMPGKTLDHVFEHVRKVVNDERVKFQESGFKSEASVVSDSESDDFQVLQRTIREVFPNVLVAPALAVVITDSRHYERITESTFRFIPTRFGRHDLDRLHGVDERIGVENYAEIVRFFIQQIRNSAAGDPDA